MSTHDTRETEELLNRLHEGDRSALGPLLALHRDYIKRVVELRMEDALLGRVDPSDVVQETQVVVTDRIDDFLSRRPTTFRLWLRRKTLEKLVDVRRYHLADKRSIRREFRLLEASSWSIAQQLLGARPSEVAQQKGEGVGDTALPKMLVIDPPGDGIRAQKLLPCFPLIRVNRGHDVMALGCRLDATGAVSPPVVSPPVAFQPRPRFGSWRT